MKRMFCWLLLSLLYLPVAFAADEQILKPILILNHIKVIAPHEQKGDELYFDITAFWADKPRKYYQVPKPPRYWASADSDKINSVPLWSEPLKPGQVVILLISLMDIDVLPMDPDDLIGIVRVKLKNENGVLHAIWSIPNRSIGPETIMGQKGEIQKFELSGPYGDYEIYLSLQSK
ncbi:hypothetical protein [Legionella oakridgensis]|uniref:Periplasmic protein n=2 Tax=Legionella oakridgensis TaxID=29423 RepID=W0BCL5_9GAMM|nr:hypothetical protein [Legionella oakridgensis]AHE66357.1 hypothetical protein Loa_00789 [Legionella oakridgensis ATCC 33761 = DSM 21215]ETO93863.1 hypothetical protein LOR_37c03960 [Legionella oakridgensis RV-2-2007]KTD43999.1 hypothetical protein Loak_0259 [Legionella oakridgensis]STY19541.1 Uncharacterised protein [Legionella longbeachae]